MKRESQLLRLSQAPAITTGAEFMEAWSKLETLLRTECGRAAAVIGHTGKELLALTACDRDQAVKLARSIAPACEIARTFRRLASIFELGAARAETALYVRPDRAEVIAEAARPQSEPKD